VTRLGVVSDTHDLLRPEVVETLRGVDRIVHLGDVCSPGLLASLAGLAPLVAVRGNCDGGAWARKLPGSETFDVEGLLIHALHDRERLEIAPEAAGVGLVLFGHSHRPVLERRGGVLFLNPGSAGPSRSGMPVSLAIVEIAEGRRPRVAFQKLG